MLLELTPLMRIDALRRKIGLLLVVCGVTVAACYGIGAYLVLHRRAPAPAPAKTAAPPPTRTLQDWVAAGNQDLKQHRIEQALVNFREALSLNPRSPEAQAGVAQGELLAGREDVAAREFERLLKLDEQNAPALLALARIESHHASGWERAEGRYNDYLKLRPDDAQAGLEFARVLAWRHEPAEAVRWFQRPAVARLMNVTDQRDEAFALVKLGRLEEAEPLIRRVLAARPGDSELRLQLADLYAARHDWTDALPLYRSLVAAHPRDASLKLNYGLGLLAARQYRAALGPLGEARAAMPSSGEAALAYARAVKGTGNVKQAVKEYERALPHFQASAPVTREYGDVLLEKRDYKKSARYYGAAYGMGLRDNRLLEGYVGALTGAGKYKAALPYLQELQRREPTPRHTFELAKLLYKLGHTREAKALLAQVEASEPRLARAR